MINYIKQNSGDAYDAQDVIQETIITIYNQAKQKKLQLTCPFDAYFFLLCKRKWLNQLNKSNRKEVTINEELLSKDDEDEQFKEAFEIYKDLSSNLEHQIANEREFFDFKANLDVISSQHFNAIHDEELDIKPSPKSNFYKYAVAASVIILLGFFVFNQFGNPSYDDYNNFESISLQERSGNDAVTIKAEESFNSQNYDEAIDVFNTILEADFSNLEIQLYKGIALVETNQFEEADMLLNKLSKGNSAYKNKAKWISALSYLKQENASESIRILKTIPKDADDYDSAQKLLNKLN